MKVSPQADWMLACVFVLVSGLVVSFVWVLIHDTPQVVMPMPCDVDQVQFWAGTSAGGDTTCMDADEFVIYWEQLKEEAA